MNNERGEATETTDKCCEEKTGEVIATGSTSDGRWIKVVEIFVFVVLCSLLASGRPACVGRLSGLKKVINFFYGDPNVVSCPAGHNPRWEKYLTMTDPKPRPVIRQL